MKKRGFTLIELLAVIVILSVVALIATPKVLDLIEKSKIATFRTSSKNIFYSAELFYQESLISDVLAKEYNFVCDKENGCISDNDSLMFKGTNPTNGKINISDEGDINGWLDFDGIVFTYKDNELVEGFVPNNSVMYSWSVEYFDGELFDYTNELLNKLNISTIYQSFPNLTDSQNINRVKTIVENGYELYYLTGSPGWANDSSLIKNSIDKLYEYNTNYPNYKIKGLVLDVQFYTLSNWNSEQQSIMNNVVSNFNDAIAYAHEHDIEIILCLPYWLDGNYKKEVESLIKMSDGVSITNYNKNILIDGIATEVELARKYNKIINNVSDFQDSNNEASSTTYGDDGLDVALQDWSQMNANFNYDNLHFAYHYLNDLLKLEMNFNKYDFVVKDSAGLLKSDLRCYVKTNDNSDSYIFARTSNNNGKFSIFLPSELYKNIEVNTTSYEVINVVNDDKNSLIEVTLGEKKTTYTNEIYFSYYDSTTNRYYTLKNTPVTIKSLDTGLEYNKITHSTDGYVALTLRYGETYTVSINDGKDYVISIGNMDSNVTSFKRESGEGNYLITKIYLKENT